MRALAHRARDGLLPLAARLSPRATSEVTETILILQPDHLGDVLLAQPAVRHLRQSFPDSRLIAVVGPWSREIALRAWPVDEVVELAYPGFERGEAGRFYEPYVRLVSEARRLRRHAPRAAVVLRPDAWWAAWLASLVAPVVTGADEPRVAPFLTQRAALQAESHAVLRALRIAQAASDGDTDRQASPVIHPLMLEVDDQARAEAVNLLTRHGVTPPFAVIHPGSGAPVKEWPLERWHAVARRLNARGLSVVVTGSAGERAICDAVVVGLERASSLAGETPLGTLIELLRGAAIALGPDSGPLHLAVAVGTPTMHVFGPSDHGRYGPWGDTRRHRVVRAGWSCPRCSDLSLERPAGCGCMLAVSIEDVIAAADELLAADVAR